MTTFVSACAFFSLRLFLPRSSSTSNSIYMIEAYDEENKNFAADCWRGIFTLALLSGVSTLSSGLYLEHCVVGSSIREAIGFKIIFFPSVAVWLRGSIFHIERYAVSTRARWYESGPEKSDSDFPYIIGRMRGGKKENFQHHTANVNLRSIVVLFITHTSAQCCE